MFKVGDRVKGRHTGNIYTIVELPTVGNRMYKINYISFPEGRSGFVFEKDIKLISLASIITEKLLNANT